MNTQNKPSDHATMNTEESVAQVLHSMAVPVLHAHGTPALLAAKPAIAPAPLTPRLARALPDLVQLSVFADGPVASRNSLTETAVAHSYFSNRPGTSFLNDEQDPQGICYSWKEGELSIRLYIKKSFSMSVRFNLQRIAAARCGLTGAYERHGNTVMPLLAEGYDLASLRQGMCQDIVDLTQQAKAIYLHVCPKALGLPVQGEVQANLSFIELAIDQPGDAELIQSYQRAFGKVVGQ